MRARLSGLVKLVQSLDPYNLASQLVKLHSYSRIKSHREKDRASSTFQ